MKAALLRLHSPDVRVLAWWTPVGDFGILVQLMVGPNDGPGQESFDITLCTTGWLSERVKEHGILEARHHLIVDSYDYGRIEQYLGRRVSELEGESWGALANKLGRIGYWEFEDYSE